jgi:hypothetical protein
MPLTSIVQALPTTHAEVLEKCGFEAVRAQWFAPYIVHTVKVALSLGKSSDSLESLDEMQRNMFVWGWEKTGAAHRLHASWLERCSVCV